MRNSENIQGEHKKKRKKGDRHSRFHEPEIDVLGLMLLVTNEDSLHGLQRDHAVRPQEFQPLCNLRTTEAHSTTVKSFSHRKYGLKPANGTLARTCLVQCCLLVSARTVLVHCASVWCTIHTQWTITLERLYHIYICMQADNIRDKKTSDLERHDGRRRRGHCRVQLEENIVRLPRCLRNGSLDDPDHGLDGNIREEGGTTTGRPFLSRSQQQMG